MPHPLQSAEISMQHVHDDGVTCLNVYSAGQTRLGRFLSNFTAAEILTPEGTFGSIEAYWYWLNVQRHPRAEELRSLSGLQAKRLGQALKKEVTPAVIGNFETKILHAIRQKVLYHPQAKEAMRASTLPFAHAYVFGNQVRQAGHPWICEGLEALRRELKEEPEGERVSAASAQEMPGRFSPGPISPGPISPAPRAGKIRRETLQVKSVLTEASGFVRHYDFTLNPYAGCTFSCVYCYAASFARTAEERDSWGKWVKIKAGAELTLPDAPIIGPGPLTGKWIYMSSVTDPYQGEERRSEVTRRILERLAAEHPGVRLVVQTRSPLVLRDLNLLSQIHRQGQVQVNITVSTDDDAARRAFEPSCPSISQRIATLKAVVDAGLPAMATLTPLLPVKDPAGFAAQLHATGVRRFVQQDFHIDASKVPDGVLKAQTSEQATLLKSTWHWDRQTHRQAVQKIETAMRPLGLLAAGQTLPYGRAGFAPPAALNPGEQGFRH